MQPGQTNATVPATTPAASTATTDSPAASSPPAVATTTYHDTKHTTPTITYGWDNDATKPKIGPYIINIHHSVATAFDEVRTKEITKEDTKALNKRIYQLDDVLNKADDNGTLSKEILANARTIQAGFIGQLREKLKQPEKPNLVAEQAAATATAAAPASSVAVTVAPDSKSTMVNQVTYGWNQNKVIKVVDGRDNLNCLFQAAFNALDSTKGETVKKVRFLYQEAERFKKEQQQLLATTVVKSQREKIEVIIKEVQALILDTDAVIKDFEARSNGKKTNTSSKVKAALLTSHSGASAMAPTERNARPDFSGHSHSGSHHSSGSQSGTYQRSGAASLLHAVTDADDVGLDFGLFDCLRKLAVQCPLPNAAGFSATGLAEMGATGHYQPVREDENASYPEAAPVPSAGSGGAGAVVGSSANSAKPSTNSGDGQSLSAAIKSMRR